MRADADSESRPPALESMGNARRGQRTAALDQEMIGPRGLPRREVGAKGGNRSRARREARAEGGHVALARRLLIELWRFLEHGVIPEGAVLKV
jgi:hypothetical protein